MGTSLCRGTLWMGLLQRGWLVSDTPRTDEEMKRISSQFDGEEDYIQYVMDQLGIHSRKLERELVTAQKQRNEAQRRVCELSLLCGRIYRRIGRENVEVTTPEGVAEMMGWKCYDEARSDDDV